MPENTLSNFTYKYNILNVEIPNDDFLSFAGLGLSKEIFYLLTLDHLVGLNKVNQLIELLDANGNLRESSIWVIKTINSSKVLVKELHNGELSGWNPEVGKAFISY